MTFSCAKTVTLRDGKKCLADLLGPLPDERSRCRS